MTTKAMPLPAGNARKNYSNAPSEPAEPPRATTGNDGAGLPNQAISRREACVRGVSAGGAIARPGSLAGGTVGSFSVMEKARATSHPATAAAVNPGGTRQ